jgi:hypothetical protein
MAPIQKVHIMTDRDKGDMSPHPPKRKKTKNVASQNIFAS